MNDAINKTQYDLIREDINLIDKYKNTNEFPGLINDILLHIKSAETQNQQLNNKFDNIKKFVAEKRGEYALQMFQNKFIDYKEEMFKYDEELNKLLESEAE